VNPVAALPFKEISEERKVQLNPIIRELVYTLKANEPVQLVFICTHNSRRSQMAQIWAYAAAVEAGLGDRIKTFSAGTEHTSFHKNAIDALKTSGFTLEPTDCTNEENPVFELNYGNTTQHYSSTVLEDPSLPERDFIAIMTCQQADEACPVVPGARSRLNLPYRDPKVADGTEEAAATYLSRSQQIGNEMRFIMEKVSQMLAY
jgi:protein-tyrosine-phosphatase